MLTDNSSGLGEGTVMRVSKKAFLFEDPALWIIIVSSLLLCSFSTLNMPQATPTGRQPYPPLRPRNFLQYSPPALRGTFTFPAGRI